MKEIRVELGKGMGLIFGTPAKEIGPHWEDDSAREGKKE